MHEKKVMKPKHHALMYLKSPGSYNAAHLSFFAQIYIVEIIPVTNAASDIILCENFGMTGLRYFRASNANNAERPETIEIHKNIIETKPVEGIKMSYNRNGKMNKNISSCWVCSSCVMIPRRIFSVISKEKNSKFGHWCKKIDIKSFLLHFQHYSTKFFSERGKENDVYVVNIHNKNVPHILHSPYNECNELKCGRPARSRSYISIMQPYNAMIPPIACKIQ